MFTFRNGPEDNHGADIAEVLALRRTVNPKKVKRGLIVRVTSEKIHKVGHGSVLVQGFQHSADMKPHQPLVNSNGRDATGANGTQQRLPVHPQPLCGFVSGQHGVKVRSWRQ
jgi:hypothetical protein